MSAKNRRCHYSAVAEINYSTSDDENIFDPTSVMLMMTEPEQISYDKNGAFSGRTKNAMGVQLATTGQTRGSCEKKYGILSAT